MTDQQATLAEFAWDAQKEQWKVFRSRFPTTERVLAGLKTIFSVGQYAPLESVERSPNEWRSTFPSEVVTCQFTDGSQLRVLCKYGLTDYTSGHGHRAGVTHEGQVYERILSPLGLRPMCYGTYSDGEGDTWLVLEFIEGVPRLELSQPGVPVLALAARWGGQFHAMTEGLVARRGAAFLNVYDETYYAGWALRTLDYAGSWHDEFPWLRSLCEAFPAHASRLLAGQEVVIHGEFTPHNIIARDTQMFPVDWESAAVGPGEIDLASLTDMWPEDLVEDAVVEYVRARWPQGAPPLFHQRLLAARAYWVLRWLGNRRDLTTRDKNRPWFDLLHRCGTELGLI